MRLLHEAARVRDQPLPRGPFFLPSNLSVMGRHVKAAVLMPSFARALRLVCASLAVHAADADRFYPASPPETPDAYAHATIGRAASVETPFGRYPCNCSILRDDD